MGVLEETRCRGLGLNHEPCGHGYHRNESPWMGQIPMISEINEANVVVFF